MMQARNRRRIRVVLGLAALAFLGVGGAGEAGAAEFTPLGDLNGGSFNNPDDTNFESEAYDISADGTTVVGRSNVGNVDGYGPFADGQDFIITDDGSDYEAFRWTEGSGMQPLGDVDTNHHEDRFFSSATAVSANGSVVAGHSRTVERDEDGVQRFEDARTEVFRWNDSRGIEGLGAYEGDGTFDNHFDNSLVTGMSADGSVIAATDRDPVAPLNRYLDPDDASFRWTSADGIEGLGTALHGSDFSGSRQSAARGVSADGRVIVGTSHDGDGNTEAFRWTEAGGMEGLGFLDPKSSGFKFSRANATDADGSVIVGRSDASSSIKPFRWTEAGGMQGLGDLNGEPFFGGAHDVAADGSVIVGFGGTEDGPFDPFIWDEVHGIRLLRDVLTEAGIDLSGWELDDGSPLSDEFSGAGLVVSSITDGELSIAGTGINPDGNTEAFRATLDASVVVPLPSSLALSTGLLGVGLLGAGRHCSRRGRGPRPVPG